MNNSLPPDSEPSTPPAVWGRWVCAFFLLSLLLPSLFAGGIVGAFFLLLLWGGVPAGLLMWLPPKQETHLDKVLYGVAIAALYLVFGGFFLYATDAASSDAQGGLIYLFVAPYTHGVWALFGGPYLIRRWFS